MTAIAPTRRQPLEAVRDGADSAQWPLWSTTARLVVLEPDRLAPAYRLVTDLLARIDLAASRFRDDSELAGVNRRAGERQLISPLLAELVDAALQAAERTRGDVDPALGLALSRLGYDRDFSLLDRPSNPVGAPVAAAGTPVTTTAAGTAGTPGRSITPGAQRSAPRIVLQRRAGWRDIRLDGRWLTLPAGIGLDLGATAKAKAADLCAALVHAELGTGVLVSLGGDIATAGPGPEGGWRVLVSDGPDQPRATIALSPGSGIATSSTIRRTWQQDGRPLHHILDPVTLQPAEPVWRTVTVAADSCLIANTLTTAALVRGRQARGWLAELGVPARLVAADGSVIALGGWPS